MSGSSAAVARPSRPVGSGRSRRIRVSHVITTLGTGGAERMLAKLVGAMDRSAFRNSVVGLGGEGAVAQQIRSVGVPVRALDLRLAHAPAAPFLLAAELRRQQPDIIQTWMYHADLLGTAASLALPRVPLVWNVRTAGLDASLHKQTTLWVGKACAAASAYFPARIVCCSQAALDGHAAAGYPECRLRVIPNGFDTDVYRPDPRHRASVREEFGVGPDVLLAGMVARYDPAKDHRTFFNAARIIADAAPGVRFVLCGEGVTARNPDFMRPLEATGIADRFILSGHREDMPRLMAALDIAVLSSLVEGFPNVLGEAMACGVPCVATDVGDCRSIIGDTGFVVPVRDASALAAAALSLIGESAGRRRARGSMARRRIIEQFSLDAAVRRYEELYEELTSPCAE